MSAERTDRVLSGLLVELADARTPDYLEAAIERASSHPQRPAWTYPGRWLPMADIASRPAFAPRLPWRTIGVALIILALLVGAAAVYIGSRQTRLPAPFGPAANGLIPYESNGDIYVGDPVSGDSRLVLGGPEADSGPSYSPDGTRIGFIRWVATSAFDIYVMRPDGSELRRITSDPLPGDSYAQWAPDSRRIAVIRQVPTTGCATTICNTNQLSLLDAVGDSAPTIVASARGMSYAEFRPPDGRQILYRALVDGKWGLFVMDADGTNQRAVVPPTVPGEMDATFGTAKYSADGKRIFYDAYTKDASYGDPGCCQLFVANADGTGLRKFVPNTGDTWDGEAMPSPDGRLIAFWHNLPNRSTHRVTVIAADGSGQPIETGPELSGTAHWVWSPDSTKILMFPDDVASAKAFLLDPNGGPYTTVPWTSTQNDLDWQRLAR